MLSNYFLSQSMLNWSALSRSANIVWRSRQAQRRPIYHFSPPPPRPSGLLAKIRFRADGHPRSRWVGAAFGSLILLQALTLFTTYNLAEDSEIALGLLASIIYIQQMDMQFDKVNFDNPMETLDYFKKLYQSFSRIPADEVDDLFKDLTRLMKLGGENNSELQAHEIMRTAAEHIHVAFQELSQDSVSHTANFVLLVMRDALEGLIELVQDAVDDDSDSQYTFQLIKDHSKKDPGNVLKDYESLG